MSIGPTCGCLTCQSGHGLGRAASSSENTTHLGLRPLHPNRATLKRCTARRFGISAQLGSAHMSLMSLPHACDMVGLGLNAVATRSPLPSSAYAELFHFRAPPLGRRFWRHLAWRSGDFVAASTSQRAWPLGGRHRQPLEVLGSDASDFLVTRIAPPQWPWVKTPYPGAPIPTWDPIGFDNHSQIPRLRLHLASHCGHGELELGALQGLLLDVRRQVLPLEVDVLRFQARPRGETTAKPSAFLLEPRLEVVVRWFPVHPLQDPPPKLPIQTGTNEGQYLQVRRAQNQKKTQAARAMSRRPAAVLPRAGSHSLGRNPIRFGPLGPLVRLASCDKGSKLEHKPKGANSPSPNTTLH